MVKHMELETVMIKNPENLNIIIGQSHFVKTAEDIYEAMMNSLPNPKFAVAFCEASMNRLVRIEGTDDELKKLAGENAYALSAGHCFFVIMRDAFPINVLSAIKNVPEVCGIFCATANQVEVIIVENENGRGILGVIDGQPPVGIEGPEDELKRKELLRNFGYKR